ncbi:MAG: hypothetical protein BMS9Abin05_2341 [Rhodothermia bacterium]|nr:MAG: hypothetical protein BMS9Abin05_2341 [Rhodothermia bacterium]
MMNDTFFVQLGGDRFRLPARAYRNLRKDLEPYRVDEESTIPYEEFFREISDDLPRWASHLQGLRYREDLTQVEFAKAVGITQPNLSAMENGKRPIGKALAKRIAEIFNTDYRHFL